MQPGHDAPTPLVLRNDGWSRINLAVFDLLLLAGWAYGAAFMFRVLAGMLGIDFDLPIDWARPAHIPPFNAFRFAYLAVVAVAWTRLGWALIMALPRDVFGVDVVELAHDAWRITHRVGPFRTTKTFAAAEGWIPEVRGRFLIARNDAKSVTASALGTITERKRVRNAIRQHFGLPAALPAGYVAEPGENGGLVITQSNAARRAAAWKQIRALPVQLGLMSWLLLDTKFPEEFAIVLAGAIVAATIGYFFARETWHLGPDVYERRRSLFGWTLSRRRIPPVDLDSFGELVARET